VLNNLGCAYRRVGKLQQAFNAMERALEIVQEQPTVPNKAVTYLNLTAVLSQMGSHERALKCARVGAKEASSALVGCL
jgi:tetratricopeptide (TPR) repeat protein